jgi:hypothetical protein
MSEFQNDQTADEKIDVNELLFVDARRPPESTISKFADFDCCIHEIKNKRRLISWTKNSHHRFSGAMSGVCLEKSRETNSRSGCGAVGNRWVGGAVAKGWGGGFPIHHQNHNNNFTADSLFPFSLFMAISMPKTLNQSKWFSQPGKEAFPSTIGRDERPPPSCGSDAFAAPQEKPPETAAPPVVERQADAQAGESRKSKRRNDVVRF